VSFDGKRRGALAAMALGLAALAAPSPATGLEAKVQTTKYGVPHITGKSIEDLAYGYGYVFARDNICTIANEYVTVSAERSRYFGPDANWRFSGNGATYKNLDADFYYESINESGIVEDLIARDPPEGPLPAVEKGVEGYVEGYNEYLADTGVDNLPDPTCRGADWVRPITELDVYRRFHQLGSLASAGAAIDGIANAAPVLDLPKVQAAKERQDEALEDLETGEAEEFFPIDSGSNAYGLGSEATRNGRGMVLGNPHFPWDGAERLYQAHLRVPGKLNVAGGSLYGVPLILIGHTRGLAWSHTVASAWRFTPFELTLNPLDPHQYLVDGEFRDMEANELTVKALVNGELENRTRTLYSTEYGPMLTSILGLPLFPWTPVKGFALGDANYENFRYLNHFYKTNLAQDVREYDRVQQRFQGIPWVNSIAADSKGEAYYSMDGTIPNVTDADASAPWPVGCAGVLGVATYPLTGIAVMDGSHSECDWGTDPDSVTEGIIGPDRIPRLFRDDYVHNGNDSHWVSNPEEPLTGYDRIIGDEEAERSLRTRIGLLQVQQRLDGTDGLPGEGFSFGQLRKVALSNRQYAGELWRDELVALCESSPTQVGEGGPVNVSAACPVLESWDLRDDLDSAGAILFRRFAENLLANFQFLPTGVSSGTYAGSNAIWDQQFNPADPVNTPSGLQTTNPLVGKALADAVTDLQGAGIPLDAGLRDHQYETRGGEQIPIHGGPGDVGVFNAINVSWDPAAGYPNVAHGSSFISAMSFREKRCPARARTFVTYGQTENQESPHASDYTRAFSEKRWNRVPFCAREVRAAPGLQTERIGSGG
jgi:acyl-homoserine-lactone acylase